MHQIHPLQNPMCHLTMLQMQEAVGVKQINILNSSKDLLHQSQGNLSTYFISMSIKFDTVNLLEYNIQFFHLNF